MSAWHHLKTSTTADATVHLVKASFSDSGYHVHVTDLGRVWDTRAEAADILALCETLNPTVDAPLKTILQHMSTAFADPAKVSAEFRIDLAPPGDVSELTMTSQLAGFPFKWNFMLQEVEPEQVRAHLTLPLLMMVSELRRQQSDLVKLLRRKDSEIDNYRMQGLKLTRKSLQTEKFDPEKFAEWAISSDGFDAEVRKLGKEAVSPDSQKLFAELVKKKNDIESGCGSLNLAEAWSPELTPKPSPSKSVVNESPAKPAEPEEPQITEDDRKRKLEEKLAKEGQKLEETKRKKRKLKL